MIPYVVSKKVIGTAYGIVLCFQSIGPIIGPMVVGRILDNKNFNVITGYLWVNLFLACGSGFAFIISIILTILDAKSGGVLMASIKRQKKLNDFNESIIG